HKLKLVVERRLVSGKEQPTIAAVFGLLRILGRVKWITEWNTSTQQPMRLRRHLANARIESSTVVSRVSLTDMCRERADLALRVALRLRKFVVNAVFGFDRRNDRLSRILELEMIIHAIIL